ncbi:MAG TPA: ATP-dependent sacrificial sulfur transferase LarE [Bacteroidota bacterium]
MTVKTKTLEAIIAGYKNVIIGFSAGVDSTLVSFVSNKVLRKNALIVLARTETITSDDVELARELAALYHFNFLEIEYNELEIENYASNPVNRCYFCKHELYTRLGDLAVQRKIPFILDGANLDDLGDYRPGRMAAKELEIKSPLIEASFTKQDVRDAAEYYGLPNSEKPSAPCLSSRIPYGTHIDRVSLERIAKAEQYIRQQGFTNVRVRHFDTTARVEVDKADIGRLELLFDDIDARLKDFGYREVEIDREGFRSGKLNATILNK